MRKMKKTLALLAIVAMVLTMIPLQLFADTAVTRLAGADRIATAVAIAGAVGTSDSAILAAADDANLVDALAVAPLAGKTIPIYLTYKNSLDAAVKAKLTGKKVTIVGAISDAVVADVKTVATSAEKVAGADRLATNALINAKLTSPAGTFVVGFDAIPDALSVASYAAANNYAIVLANPDGSVASSKIVGSKTYIVGGPTLVKDIAGATRFSGANRMATNAAVLSGLTFSYDKVYVANGNSLVDALVAAPLAAQTNSPILLSDGSAVDATAATYVKSKMSATSVVIALGGAAVVSENARGLNAAAAPTGILAVKSVAAASATSFAVTFNQAPADTKLVTVTVTLGSTPITTTLAWNADKTVATATSSSTLPEGTYTVAVKNDKTDLGSNTVAITQQKVAKIEITSTKLAVTNSPQYGYASYKVTDQYGNDITTNYLGNACTFQSGVGSCNNKDGLITITPSANISIITFTSVVITGYDSSTGVSTSATLATSTALGTLSSIALNKLTSDTNKDLTYGDTSTTWYIDYTAKDLSGIETKNYDLIRAGLITTTDSFGYTDCITTSSSNIRAQIVQDTSDDTKAAIAVTYVPPTGTDNGLSMDIPISITAMSYTGTTSTLNLTLKRAATVDSFTLMAPSFSVAVNETKEIPFVAYDQAGNQLKNYSDISGKVTFSGSITLNQNVDGTAQVMFAAGSGKGTQTVTAVVANSGKMSSVTINVQDAAVANSLTIDTTRLITTLQAGAVQRIDYGFTYGGMTVKDQYDRVVDMTQVQTTNHYTVYASLSTGTTTTSSSVIALNGADGSAPDLAVTSGAPFARKDNAIQIAGLTAGTGTVVFSLVDLASPAPVNINNPTMAELAAMKVLDTKSVSFSVLGATDTTNIVGYTIDTVANPIYAKYDSTKYDPATGYAYVAYNPTISTTSAGLQLDKIDNTKTPANTAGNTAGLATSTNKASGATVQTADSDQAYDANPFVYGLTSSGSKVVLAGNVITGAYVNSTDFFVDATGFNVGNSTHMSGGRISRNPNGYDNVCVAAKTLADNVTSSSTTLTVTLIGADKLVHSLTTTIKSTTDMPVATLAVAFPNPGKAGYIGISDDKKTVTMSIAPSAALPTTAYASSSLQAGKTMTRWSNVTGTGTDRAGVYFYAKDQYQGKGCPFVQVYVVSVVNSAGVTYGSTVALPTIPFTVDPATGYILTNSCVTGDQVTVTGVTASGAAASIKIIFQ